MDRWMMGQLSASDWGAVWPVVPLLAPALIVLLALARPLDQVVMGEALAGGRGVDVARLQRLAFIFGSLAVGAVVAVAGPIGFVGLIVPHTVRRLVGPGHGLMLPCTLLAGGGFLVICDTIARTAYGAAELPVGIVTALLGGPFFIYLLVQGRRRGRMWSED
jgi:iron complex transport system permease protein